MGTTKYAVPDVQAFDNAMLAACVDDEERGIVFILSLTGMHASSLLTLTTQSIVRRGGTTFLTWERPKTHKRLECAIPRERVPLVEGYVARSGRPVRRQQVNFILRRVGRRCGYTDTSCMTFRHNYCSRLIEQGESLLVIPTMMGCSTEVAVRNYAKRRAQARFDDSQTDGSI